MSTTEADLLGAGRAARQLAGLLLSSRDSTPFTLAVDAGWGMGKSSLMRLVDAELTQAPEVETVWYNAWTSTGADALEGLIKSVLMRFDRRVLRRGLQRVSERRALLRVLRAAVTVAAGPLGVAGLVDELWKNLSVNSQARNEMRGAIRDLVQEWAQTAEHRPRRLLVVFIDDLDRCSEETVLAICEAVKIYLDVPGLAFVVGCDRSALGPNGLLRDLSPAGSAFMEKIFQTSYRVPAADGHGVKEYIRWCARTAGVAPLLDDALVDLLAQQSARNPRRIKRLVNGFVLEATLNPVWRDFGPGAVIRTLLLQHFYPDFYRMMTGPVGVVDGDVVAEFRTYREVRRTLMANGSGASEAERDRVREFLAQYDLVPPEALGVTGDVVLESLERQLPTDFAELVTSSAFLSLIEELMSLPDAANLLLRLREGPQNGPGGPGGLTLRPSEEWNALWDGAGDERAGEGPHRFPFAWSLPQQQAAGAPAPQLPPQGSQAGAGHPDSGGYGQAPSPYGYPVSGQPAVYGQQPAVYGQQPAVYGQAALARLVVPQPGSAGLLDILWVDDKPDRNRDLAETLESFGTRVRTATDKDSAIAAVRQARPGLLISNIGRGRNRDAGIEMVEKLREELYDGPVIFYTRRNTQDRNARAAELGVRGLTHRPGELSAMVLDFLREQAGEAAAAQQAPLSGGPVPRSAG
ncbi:P-loop NTPase fold protein [Streptomyces sp. MST-110588]|uniref:P-loop NTPase fold protein n=1 Tax=Streptomyces sp. MST-110588 TaxID=2833628 RepID=UPI001F5D3950|nr:P-loop NTPase fold protein [Streptomyces sp. MST-110588]